MYAWTSDNVIADLNSQEKRGVLTRFHVFRTCFINLLFLMAGALWTSLKKNRLNADYFIFITGNVLRKDIVDVKSFDPDPEGDDDYIVDNSLAKRLSRHSEMVSATAAVVSSE
jgi:hypothetical protein